MDTNKKLSMEGGGELPKDVGIDGGGGLTFHRKFNGEADRFSKK